MTDDEEIDQRRDAWKDGRDLATKEGAFWDLVATARKLARQKMELETRCDPSGDVRTIASLKEQVEALTKLNEENENYLEEIEYQWERRKSNGHVIDMWLIQGEPRAVGTNRRDLKEVLDLLKRDRLGRPEEG